MEPLVIYYSIFGNNEKFATKIAQDSNYDIVEFNPGTKLRVFQFFMRKKRLSKKAKNINIHKYSKLKIFGPIWAAKPAPAIIKLLENIGLKEKIVSCFFTYGQDYGTTENQVKDIIETNGGICAEISFRNIDKEKEI